MTSINNAAIVVFLPALHRLVQRSVLEFYQPCYDLPRLLTTRWLRLRLRSMQGSRDTVDHKCHK
ncbi:unnamed protein product [Ixodes pacificus]